MMRTIVAIAAAFTFFSAGADEAGAQPAAAGQGPAIPLSPAPTLDALSNPPSKASTGVPDLRAQMLRDAAHTVGFRGGMAARTQELLGALNRRAETLSAMFQFAPLVSPSGTVPPVIEAARDVATFTPDQVRKANHVYKIEREERFVSVPPSWREYLLVGLPTKPTVDLPDLAARPQNDQEEVIWKAGVADGWAEGRSQADEILASNFHRIVRDYTGMMTYATLLQHGMISTTRVAESQQTVTGDTRQIVLGDTLLRMTAKAGFETDPRRWTPMVRSAPSAARAASPASAPDAK